MILITTKDKKQCKKCAGFGVFEFNPTRLEPCKNCNSIHPEQLGLRYEKEGNNYHFYIIKSKLLDWILNDI